MTRKLSPYEGSDDFFKKDDGVRIKVMVPVLEEDNGFNKCILEMQSYHETSNDKNHYVLFTSPNGDGTYSLEAAPINYNIDDIMLCDKVGDDGEVGIDLIKDLTTIFYSADSVLDMVGELLYIPSII